MATLKKIYADLDLTFTRLPVSGDVAIVYDDNAVIKSVRNLLLTKHFERLFQPDIGSNIDILLFENIEPLMETTLAKEIQNIIENYEPRVKLSEVTVSAQPDNNAYSVTLKFFISNNTQPTQVTLLLERNR